MGSYEEGTTVLVRNDNSGGIPPSKKKQGLWDKLAISLSCRLKGVSEPKDKGAHDIVKSLFLLSELDMEPKSAPPKILEEKNAGQPKISEEKNAGQPKLLTDAQKFRYKADAHELRIINSWGEGSERSGW
jgi:hypothetical protein